MKIGHPLFLGLPLDCTKVDDVMAENKSIVATILMSKLSDRL